MKKFPRPRHLNVIQHEANDKAGSLMFHEKEEKKKRDSKGRLAERRQEKSIKVKQTGRKKRDPKQHFLHSCAFRIVGLKSAVEH
jgi:hypothetical protein